MMYPHHIPSGMAQWWQAGHFYGILSNNASSHSKHKKTLNKSNLRNILQNILPKPQGNKIQQKAEGMLKIGTDQRCDKQNAVWNPELDPGT